MGCLESLKYEILERFSSFPECRDYVKEHCSEYYEVDPGFKVFDVYIIGIPPVLIGLSGDTLIFPFTKPCHGTFIVKIENKDEADSVRKRVKKKR